MAIEYRDLRQFIELVEKMGDLRRIQGAALEFEIGAITEVAAGSESCPALLFSDIPGQPAGNPASLGHRSESAAATSASGVETKARGLEADCSKADRGRAVPGKLLNRRCRRPVLIPLADLA